MVTLGQKAMKWIPAIAREMGTIGRKVLPELMAGVRWIEKNAPGAFRLVKQTVKTLYPDIKDLATSLVNLAPKIVKLGTKISETLLPFLTDVVRLLDEMVQWVLRLNKKLPAFKAKIKKLGEQFGMSARDMKDAKTALKALGLAVAGLVTGGTITTLIGLAGSLGTAWKKNLFGIRDTTKTAFQKVRQTFTSAKPTLKRATNKITGAVTSGFQQLQTDLKPTLTSIKRTARTAFNQTEKNVKTAMGAIERQIIDKSKTASTKFASNIAQMETEAKQTWTTIKNIINRLTGAIGKNIRSFAKEISKIWRQHMTGNDGIVASARQAFNTIWSFIIKPFLDTVQGAWKLFGDDLIRILDGVLGTIELILTTTLDAILTAINVTLDLISGDWEEAWNGIAGFVERTIGRIESWLKNDAARMIGGAIDVVIKAIKAPFKAVYDWLIGNSFIPEMFGEVVDYIKNDAVNDLVSAGKKLASDTANAIIDKFNKIMPNKLEIPEAELGGQSIDLPSVTIAGQTIGGGTMNVPSATLGGQTLDIPQLDTGGLIEETGLAQVHAGEEIVPKAEVDRSGGRGRSGRNAPVVGSVTVYANGQREGQEAARGLVTELRSLNMDY